MMEFCDTAFHLGVEFRAFYLGNDGGIVGFVNSEDSLAVGANDVFHGSFGFVIVR